MASLDDCNPFAVKVNDMWRKYASATKFTVTVYIRL